MTYWVHYRPADALIAHFDAVVATATPQLAATYTGFLAVSAVTAYELAIKAIFVSFSDRKHKVLGNFTRVYFERINGRVKIQIIRDDYLAKYGSKYLTRFERTLDLCEQWHLRNHLGSVRSSYSNLITWRNEFAHEGRLPNTATYAEARKSYFLGKEVIQCLALAMTR